MCVTAIVVAVASAALGTYSKIQGANAQAANAAYRSRVEIKQADEQRRSAEVQALQQENARREDFSRARSSAMAAIGASGIGEHISFFKAIDPDAQTAFLRDVRNVRLNLQQEKSTLSDRVQVSEFSSRIAKYNSGIAKIGAIAEFMQVAMGAAQTFGATATPTAPPAGG